MEKLVAQERRFDVVETGTIADDHGLFNLIVHATPLLNSHVGCSRSLIHVATERAWDSRDDYLRRNLPLPLEAYPTLLGVNLYERSTNEDWSTHASRFAWSKARVEGRDEPHREEFTFYRLEFPTVPISLSVSDFVTDSLAQCLEALSQTPEISHLTGSVIPKLLGFALAAGRIAWQGPTAITPPPLLASYTAEILVQSHLYGFPIDFVGKPRDTFVIQLDGLVDCPAAATGLPISLQIAGDSTIFRFRSLRLAPGETGGQLRVMTFVSRDFGEKIASGKMPISVCFGDSLHVPLTQINTTRVLTKSLTTTFTSSIKFAAERRYLQSRGEKPVLTPPSQQVLPVRYAYEERDSIKLLVSVPTSQRYVQVGKLAIGDDLLRCAEGGALLLFGKKVQIMQLPCRLSPVDERVALGDIDTHLADYSDRYRLGKVETYDQGLALASLRYTIPGGDVAALVQTLDSTHLGDADPGRAVALARAPSAADQARFLSETVKRLLAEFARGTLVVEFVSGNDPTPMAAVLLYHLTVVPAASTARAPTPMLSIEFILHPSIACKAPLHLWIVDQTNARVLSEIGRKAERGRAKVTQLRVPREYLPCLVDLLMQAYTSAPHKISWNEANFDRDFFDGFLLKKRLFPAHLLPLYHPPGAECRVAKPKRVVPATDTSKPAASKADVIKSNATTGTRGGEASGAAASYDYDFDDDDVRIEDV
ncbi:hypothetical protein H9P43_009724 [Blastocladiella emersonii ATCC 22665]|nr:hypothetical protein H9P43_009724 [Blastocladiella emersonii ATCC 22665]